MFDKTMKETSVREKILIYTCMYLALLVNECTQKYSNWMYNKFNLKMFGNDGYAKCIYIYYKLIVISIMLMLHSNGQIPIECASVILLSLQIINDIKNGFK